MVWFFTDNNTTTTKLFCFVLFCWLGCGNIIAQIRGSGSFELFFEYFFLFLASYYVGNQNTSKHYNHIKSNDMILVALYKVTVNHLLGVKGTNGPVEYEGCISFYQENTEPLPNNDDIHSWP